jgi:hypothetical protein
LTPFFLAAKSLSYALLMLESARKSGLDITTETYPYTAAFTRLDSEVFSEACQQQYGISYDGLQWVSTGERLTAESFQRYGQQGGWVIVHAIPDEAVRVALASPVTMVGSDGLLEDGKGHPRAAGSFARVLARYVRTESVLSLMEAIRKMSYLPAQKLGITSNGRIEVGADADIVVFDPERDADRATFEESCPILERNPIRSGWRRVRGQGVATTRRGARLWYNGLRGPCAIGCCEARYGIIARFRAGNLEVDRDYDREVGIATTFPQIFSTLEHDPSSSRTNSPRLSAEQNGICLD